MTFAGSMARSSEACSSMATSSHSTSSETRNEPTWQQGRRSRLLARCTLTEDPDSAESRQSRPHHDCGDARVAPRRHPAVGRRELQLRHQHASPTRAFQLRSVRSRLAWAVGRTACGLAG